MEKYEISLWEDFPDTYNGITFLNERRIAVIGSNTMTSQVRALEPNLVEEINGSNTFTFKMYYTYIDPQTGEKYDNPFGQYLINERKVKVYWKDKWYDFVIKKCQEDSSQRSVIYTCKDLFINELSKQGYSLEFATELQNNIGTAKDLAEKVLDGSTWMYDEEASTPIIQKTEGPVYETTTKSAFTCKKQSPSGDSNVTIPINKSILVFYDSLVDLFNKTVNNVEVQFLYAADGYITDINDMLVINGDCYVAKVNIVSNNFMLTAKNLSNDSIIFQINYSEGVSQNYRAARLIKSQKTVFEPLLNRYVSLCEDSNHDEVRQIVTTEFSNPVGVINLVANPNNFTSLSGWINLVKKWITYPQYNSDTNLSTFKTKSYLLVDHSSTIYTYNSAIQSNISYFTPTESEKQQGKVGGIQKEEKYIFRIKVKQFIDDVQLGIQYPGNFEDRTSKVSPNVYKYTSDYKHTGNPIFNITNKKTVLEIVNDETEKWLEYTLTATESVPATKINEYGLFIDFNAELYIQDAQFFKYAEGITSYDEGAEVRRINPGEINLQSLAKTYYKYYIPDSTITNANEMTFAYVGEEPSPSYTPVYNNYEKIGTITESGSNRFNILQSIAETFQAWVRFRIDHESNGAIKVIEGRPQKYVYFAQELEHDNGLSFEYGIDLKTITRSIDSDNLATKIIVNPNNNQFAESGFCSIARSNNNYCKENFILNLDYFIQQNLLNKDGLYADLYGTASNNIGYYYYLHKYNKEYDSLTSTLTTKQLDLIRENSEKEIYEQYLSSAEQRLGTTYSDLLTLSSTNNMAGIQEYANNHPTNVKVQSLLSTYGRLQEQIAEYREYLNTANATLETLSDYINNAVEQQKELIALIKDKHLEFNNKYSNYLMEGTWQDENYVDDDKYYLDALQVAYTSSRPQLSYNINVLRLSFLEEFSSKIFNLGDICYIQDREFFGYLSDGITPYKEKILVSKISSYFDSPEKDVLTVQNYKTRFDDLFQRIAATTQSLSYAEGSYQRAADSVKPDGTIDLTVFQNTFDKNADLVLNSSNQDVTWDNTGITITDKTNTASKTKILAGGIFVTADGINWKNAVRGDGISTDLLDAGKINTGQIFIYDGTSPTFRWDNYGITAYSYSYKNNTKIVDFGRFVRFDQYGIYGYNGTLDFIPTSESNVWDNANFGLTWSGFFLKSSDSNSVFEISNDKDLVISRINGNDTQKCIQIGRLGGEAYGMALYDNNNNAVFLVKTQTDDGGVTTNSVTLAGWDVEADKLSRYVSPSQYAYLWSNGTLEGKYGNTEWKLGYNGNYLTNPTVSGAMMITKPSNPSIYLQNTSKDTTLMLLPSTQQASIYFTDKNGYLSGWVQSTQAADGKSSITIGARHRNANNDNNVNNYLTLSVTDDTNEATVYVPHTEKWKEGLGINDIGMNFMVSKLSSNNQFGTLNWNVKNTSFPSYLDHRVGLVSTINTFFLYDFTEGVKQSIWVIPTDAITNSVLNNTTSYSTRTDAANAIWNSMGDGKHKIGRVQIVGTNYTYWAMRNSSNYAVVVLTTYSGATIFKYVKTNGTVSGYVFTGTSDS